MTIRIQTKRLTLRDAELADAPFILKLVNEPEWLKFIGDKKAYDIAGAERYIRENLQGSYKEHGYGLYIIEDSVSQQPMGLCGLVNRPTLDEVDLGYAVYSAFRGQGIAKEAATATLKYAAQQLKLRSLLALTTPDNQVSINLLESLGFQLVGCERIGDSSESSNIYRKELAESN